MSTRAPAELFSVGEFLQEELDARQWGQQALADRLGCPLQLVSELISGERAVTPEIAKGLANAFGTSPHYWIALAVAQPVLPVADADS